MGIEILFAPILIFLMHPGRIALVAILFFVASLYFSVSEKRAMPTGIASVGWALWAMWELVCKEKGYNIRVDLILIVPVLFVLTGSGLASLVQKQKAMPTEEDEV